MPQYLSPGVYVEEVDRGSKPIEGVSTAVAAFVGFTEKGPRTPMLITNWDQYRATFGGFIEGAYTPTSVYGYFNNGGSRAYVMRVSPAISAPQSGNRRSSLEVTPLLSAGLDEPISISVAEGSAAGRYKLTVYRGDTTETFDDLSSDKKDPNGRYVETVVNDPLTGSKFVRACDTSGNRASAVTRAPKAGDYGFPGAPIAELPAPSVRLNARGGDVPVAEFSPASGASGKVTVEVADVAGQDELVKVTVKTAEATESFDVSFKKGPQYLETVINASKTGSKLVRAKDLSGDSNLSPADKRPAATTQSLATTDSKATGGKAKVSISSSDFTGDVADRTGMGALAALDDVTIVCMPDLMMLYQKGIIDMKAVQVVQTAMMNHCEAMKYRVAVIDCPPDMTPQQIGDWRMKEANYDSKYAALYYPWIEIDNPMEKGKTMFSPPSGHIAGVWARTDSERGVHKAPANEIIRGVVGLETQITMGEQDGLNPIGVNCIRSFPGRGIRIWGARTLSSDPSWKYLNVRRLFNYVEASIENGTQWIVFEPNDANLWARIKRDVNSFLYLTWMSGALFGATPDQAYYVKCDDQTNPPAVIDAGQVITEIGISPVKPAEFVVFRIGQMAGGGA